MSIIFFGGHELGHRCLNVLLNKDVRPEYVVPNPDDTGEDTSYWKSVRKLAKNNNLEILDFEKLTSENLNEIFCSKKPQVGFCAFFSRIIPGNIIDFFEKGITNFHFSLLPEYRGQYPTVHAIFNGDTKTGVTFHWINKEVDAGEIIIQEELAIEPDENGYSLFQKCLIVAEEIFMKQILFYKEDKWPSRRPQIYEDRREYPLHTTLPNRGVIDWNWDGAKVNRFLRALYFPPYPMPEIELGKHKFDIIEKDKNVNK